VAGTTSKEEAAAGWPSEEPEMAGAALATASVTATPVGAEPAEAARRAARASAA
jgi:hypothetical protein